MSTLSVMLKEEIAVKNAKIHYLGEQEMKKGKEIQALIIAQSKLFDEVVALEVQLAKEKKS